MSTTRSLSRCVDIQRGILICILFTRCISNNYCSCLSAWHSMMPKLVPKPFSLRSSGCENFVVTALVADDVILHSYMYIPHAVKYHSVIDAVYVWSQVDLFPQPQPLPVAPTSGVDRLSLVFLDLRCPLLRRPERIHTSRSRYVDNDGFGRGSIPCQSLNEGIAMDDRPRGRASRLQKTRMPVSWAALLLLPHLPPGTESVSFKYED